MNQNLSSYWIDLGFSILDTKRFGSRFICLRNSPKVGFFSLSEFASLLSHIANGFSLFRLQVWIRKL